MKINANYIDSMAKYTLESRYFKKNICKISDFIRLRAYTKSNRSPNSILEFQLGIREADEAFTSEYSNWTIEKIITYIENLKPKNPDEVLSIDIYSKYLGYEYSPKHLDYVYFEYFKDSHYGTILLHENSEENYEEIISILRSFQEDRAKTFKRKD